ncbi:MAG: gliding motility-associated C-terminal domain-containing protein, partial [Bacteroidia bacterium]|nr:gliding motility-associated C-terminal domain-containing protein [Bacteroidia bacterium]
DNLGCTGTDNISVTVTTTSDASFSYTSSTFCQSGVDPTPTVVTPGGTFSSSSVNLIINTSTGVIDLSASANGTYQVTYTTPAPCSASSNVTITITTAPDAEFSYNGPYCEGATNPLPSHVTGTNGIYTSAPPGLNFVNANTGEINLQTTSPGSYTITNTINVTGCGIATDNYNVTIYDSPNIGITPDPAATCSNTNLQLQGNPSGGTMPYSHTWTGNISFLSSTSISNPVFNAPAGGVYNFTYSVSDGHSCTSSDNISITVYNNPTASIIPMSANVCEGVNLQLNGNPVQGSGSIVSHLWTGSDTSPLSATNIVNPVFNASNNGVYTLYYTVTDNNGCTGRDTIIINVYNNPTVNITPAEPVNVCSGVSLQLNGNPVQGSAVIINHQWTGDFEPLSSTTIPNPVFTSGASGIYNLTYQVTDNNSCTASDNITINVQSSPSASITPNPASVCEGEDLQLNGNPSGGTGNYTHEWDGDYGPLSSTTIASPVFNTNTSGNYNLQYTVTDGNGCEGTSSITVSVYNNPSVVILPDKPEICAGTSLDLTANVTMGSGLPNDYEWTGNTGPLSSTTTTTTTFYTETPGSYFLQFNVGDVNGCGAMDTITVIVFPKPEADITPDPAIVCSGADLQLNGNPSGGSGIYMHDWDGATSSLSATNIENPVFNNDIEGNYQLTYMVVDDRGCSGIDIINIIVSPSPDLSTFVDSANCSVADGSAWVVASGGLTPYSYLWDDNSVNDTLYNVPAGLYSVTVTDANTCSSSVIVEIPNIGAGEVTIKLVNGIICFGGSDAILTVSMTGGTPPFDYYWLSGNDTIATTDTVYDLPAGPFEVGIWDAGLCFASDTFTVLQPPAINTTISPVHISCFGLTNGQASLSVSGGTPTYTYLWNTLQTTPIISNLSAGTYYVTVTDNYSCSIIDTAIIVEPAQILVNFQNITDITCYGYSDGAVTASGSGGVPGYTFNWSNLTTNATLSNVSAGSYIVTITDANGCTAKDTIELAQPDSLYLAGSSIDATCNNSNGQATVTVTDGTAPYSYEWEAAAGAQTTATAVNLSQGEYTVLVTDSNDCESNIDVLVGNVPSGTVTVTVNSHISCFGLSDGEMWASVTTGGNPPYTFLWSNTSNDTIISNLTAGAYNVTITDANNCSATGDDFISQPLALIIKSALHNVTCFGYSDGQIDLDVDNGTEPYSYLWSDSTTTEDLYYLSGDTFSVTVTDANGCIKIDSFVITEPDEIGLEWTSTEAVCYGTNTGSATVTASGGVGGYSYSWCSTAGYQTTAIATNLFGGYYYSVTVTDSTGCDMHIGNNVAQPTQIIIIDSATYVRNASCVENNDGKIIIGLEGGILPYHYEWSNGSSTDSLINITEGLYTVTVTDSHQCKFDTIFKVISAPENCLVIPHALTPNNDGKNDTWRIKNIQLYGNINIEIYNRWGNLVFSFDGTGTEYNDRSQQWAGKGPNGVDLPHGSYLFIIEFLDNSDLEPVTGAVSIIK